MCIQFSKGPKVQNSAKIRAVNPCKHPNNLGLTRAAFREKPDEYSNDNSKQKQGDSKQGFWADVAGVESTADANNKKKFYNSQKKTIPLGNFSSYLGSKN